MWLVQVVWIPEAGVVFRKVCGQYYGVVAVEVANEADYREGIISCEVVLDSREVCVLKYLCFFC